MSVRTLLETEIESELLKLGELTPGTDEYKTVQDGLVKMLDKANELEKIKDDYELRAKAHEIEMVLEEQKLSAEKKDRVVKNVINIGGIVITTVTTVWGVLKTLKFEETGTVTTQAGRSLIQRLFSRK